MPLISIERHSSPQAYEMGVWRISEDEENLERMCHDIRPDPQLFRRVGEFKSKQRRVETYATYLALHALTGRTNLFIGHNDDGSPLLDGLNISISHTKGYAAVILSPSLTLGIDIEIVGDRIERVTDYFLRDDEFAPDVTDKTVQWCAKETAFKFFSSLKPAFLDLRSYYNADSMRQGFFLVEETNSRREITIKVRSDDNYVLTHTVG